VDNGHCQESTEDRDSEAGSAVFKALGCDSRQDLWRKQIHDFNYKHSVDGHRSIAGHAAV